MMNARKPDFTGKLQVKQNIVTGAIYRDMGEIALWKHGESKFILRGYVTIDNTKYLVSLIENGAEDE
jgi:hypothetical protein